MFRERNSCEERENFNSVPFQGFAGSKFTYFTDESSTPNPRLLHVAALKGDVVQLKSILDRKVPVDSRDQEGTTALLLACRYNYYDCAKLLLKYGADPKAQRVAGFSCLCYAAIGGYLPIVKLLIKHGADIEACGVDGRTPFMLACECNHLDIVEELFSCGVDLERKTPDSSSALYMAAQNGHLKILSFLASKGADVNVKRVDDTTAVGIASKMGHVKLVQELIKYGAKVNTISKFTDETLLHTTALSGHMEIIEILVKAGCDPCAKDILGKTAYVNAMKAGHTDVANYLALAELCPMLHKMKETHSLMS